MSWSDSTTFFGSASEMAHDVAAMLESKPLGLLPMHILEPFLMPMESSSIPTLDLYEDVENNTAYVNKFCCLLEMFVDDFINIAQTTNKKQLWHIS
jgi:hypothetical protein